MGEALAAESDAERGLALGMRHSQLAAYLVIAFLMGGGLYLAWSGGGHLYTLHRLSQHEAATEGRVVGKATRALSRGGQSSVLVVEYEAAGHPTITKVFDVDGPTYRAAVASGKARVRYHPEDPSISLVTKFAALPFQILVGFGVLMALAGAFCIWHLNRANTTPAGGGGKA